VQPPISSAGVVQGPIKWLSRGNADSLKLQCVCRSKVATCEAAAERAERVLGEVVQRAESAESKCRAQQDAIQERDGKLKDALDGMDAVKGIGLPVICELHKVLALSSVLVRCMDLHCMVMGIHITQHYCSMDGGVC
jgi:hypothetical protein